MNFNLFSNPFKPCFPRNSNSLLVPSFTAVFSCPNNKRSSTYCYSNTPFGGWNYSKNSCWQMPQVSWLLGCALSDGVFVLSLLRAKVSDLIKKEMKTCTDLGMHQVGLTDCKQSEFGQRGSLSSVRAQMQTSVTPTASEEDCERVVNLKNKQEIFHYYFLPLFICFRKRLLWWSVFAELLAKAVRSHISAQPLDVTRE